MSSEESASPSRARVWQQILFGPARFWLGVAILLFAVGGVAYTYGAWYGAVLAMDAVPVREIQQRSSWTGQFAYREEADGLRVRVRRPAPDSLRPEFALDTLAEVNLGSAGYSSYGEARGLLAARADEEADEEAEAEEQKPIDRGEYLRAMRETGLLTGAEQATGRNHTVVVDEFGSQDEAREVARRLRESGRDVALEEVRGDDGSVSYRLQSGSFASVEAAEAYQRELQAAGLMEGGAPAEEVAVASDGPGPSTGGQGSSAPPTDVTPPSDPAATEAPPEAPPTDPTPPPVSDPVPPPEGSGGGRALGDL